MSDDNQEEKKPDSLILLALKRMGYLPGTFVLMGVLLAEWKTMLGDKTELGLWIDLAAGSFVATGLLWWLVRLFGKLFTNRPARGLFDGLLAGIVAGLIGGYFGYGWIDWWQVNDPTFDNIWPGMLEGRPRWVRVVIVFVFTVPIAGLLGLGCDLIHTDRRINWRRNFSTIFLVGAIFLIAVGIVIIRFSPMVNVRGISFSEWLILFEIFVLVYPALVAVSFGWKWKKMFSRYVWIIGAIILTRLVTYLWQTHDEDSIAWAQMIGRAAANATSVSLWERQTCFETYGQDEFNLATGVVGFCLWTATVYALFYFNHTPAVALDKWIMRRKRKPLGRKVR